MSKNRNRAKLKKAQNGREYKLIIINEKYPLYYDECWHYRKTNKSWELPYKIRMYRTWKHNRKKQYK